MAGVLNGSVASDVAVGVRVVDPRQRVHHLVCHHRRRAQAMVQLRHPAAPACAECSASLGEERPALGRGLRRRGRSVNRDLDIVRPQLGDTAPLQPAGFYSLPKAAASLGRPVTIPRAGPYPSTRLID